MVAIGQNLDKFDSCYLNGFFSQVKCFVKPIQTKNEAFSAKVLLKNWQFLLTTYTFTFWIEQPSSSHCDMERKLTSQTVKPPQKSDKVS